MYDMCYCVLTPRFITKGERYKFARLIYADVSFSCNSVIFILRGLKDLFTPVLAGILESDPANAMSFEEFFARIQDILSRKV